MTVLITHASGQLGLDLQDAFADHTVIGLTRDELDVTSEEAVWDALSAHTPAVVVNAGAWTDLEGCETDHLRAHRANALGPWWLARACSALGSTLVHVSTAHVFGGVAPVDVSGTPRGWSEFDAVAPLSAYGRSRAAGEYLVRQTLPAHHIVRTAWVDGARGPGFVRALLEQAAQGETIHVAEDQIGSPTFSRDLSVAIRELAFVGRYGTINRTNTGTCSRYELAATVFESEGVEVELVPVRSLREDAPTAACWSVLDPCHASALGLTPLPAWRDSLHDLLVELKVGRGEPPGHRVR